MRLSVSLIGLILISTILSCTNSINTSSTILITGATLFDGTGAPGIENSIIVIKDGKIDCAGNKDTCDIPKGAEQVNADGKYITPGLVDAHMHFFQTAFFDSRPDALDLNDSLPIAEVIAYQQQNPQRYYDSYLCSGVTAVYDVGGMSWSIGLQQAAENNPRAPHVAAAGPLITPVSGAPFDLPSDKVLVPLTSADQGIKTVQYLSELGSTGIKFWQLRANDPEYMDWVSASAMEIEKRGNQMIAHATSLEQAKAALRNGAKLLVHSVENTEVDDEFIELAKENGTFYNPTLIVGSGYMLTYRATADIENFQITDPNRCVDLKTKTLLENADRFKNHPRFENSNLMIRIQNFDASTDRVSSLQLKNLKTIFDAGIPIVVGTDAGNPGTLHGISIYDEMEAMQSAGIPAKDIIVMATKNGAASMMRADDFGTIEAGKFGNLIILDKDPSIDISNMRSISHVMIKGNLNEVSSFSSQ